MVSTEGGAFHLEDASFYGGGVYFVSRMGYSSSEVGGHSLLGKGYN